MGTVHPDSIEELADSLAAAARQGQTIELTGAGSKRLMGGPIAPADVQLTTTRLNKTLQYEPQDLTISVEAGTRWRELTRLLAPNRQMIPLDPPFSDAATVGGVVAANTSGPRRRLYGTARDLIIGMKFVTLEGKVVQSGGMVVKNVAGLDMGKLMIGSFGTLAAIAVVNFKLIPTPEATQTFVRSFATVEQAIASRDELIRSVLQPSAIDLLNPAAAERVGLSGWCLAIQAGGSPAVLARYERELGGADRFSGDTEDRLWANIREFTPCWLTDHPHGSVLRVSTKLDGVGVAISQAAGPAVARAGTGIVYVYSKEPVQANGKAVVEYAPADVRETMCLWPDPGSDFAMMKKIKELFDPRQFLNRRRLYGRI